MTNEERKKLLEKTRFSFENPINKEIALTVNDLLSIDIEIFRKEHSNTILDDLCFGFAQKSLNIFAGASGSGKSLLLLHIAYNFALTHDKVCYISFENDIDTDIARIHEMVNTYGGKSNLNYYNYTMLSNAGYGVTKKDIYKLFEDYDYIFLDEFQIVFDSNNAEDGAGMHVNGNKIMKELYNISISNNKIFFLTWQLARGAKAKTKEEQCTDDISYSIGVIRYAKTVWIIDSRPCKKEECPSWTIKLDKTRNEGIQGKIVSVYDRLNKRIDIGINK